MHSNNTTFRATLAIQHCMKWDSCLSFSHREEPGGRWAGEGLRRHEDTQITGTQLLMYTQRTTSMQIIGAHLLNDLHNINTNHRYTPQWTHNINDTNYRYTPQWKHNSNNTNHRYTLLNEHTTYATQITGTHSSMNTQHKQCKSQVYTSTLNTQQQQHKSQVNTSVNTQQ